MNKSNKLSLEDCKKWKKKPTKNIPISLKITKGHSKWLAKNDLSPTAIFMNASEQLGFKEDE